MIEGIPIHEPTADERNIVLQLMYYRDGVLKGTAEVRRECWAEIDALLDELNLLGRLAMQDPLQ